MSGKGISKSKGLEAGMNNGGRFEKELESPGIYNRKEGENWKAKLKGNRCQKGLLDQESPLDSKVNRKLRKF